MNFPLYIAKRYLFTKTSNNAINIITIIASFGVIVGALALFIILSGFSGLRTFSYELLDVSDPDIKITSHKGKSFFITESLVDELNKNTLIKDFTEVIEERVFLEYKNKTEIAYIKGVQDNYTRVSKIDSSLTMGVWLNSEFNNTAVIGRGISNKLSLGIFSYGTPLKILVPKTGDGFINPRNPFNKINTQVVGVYYGNEEFENKFVYTSIKQAKELLKFKKNQITAIELNVAKEVASNLVANQLSSVLGKDYKIQTKEQLNEVFYKVINTENFVSYLIFTLIVIIALFNVIGAIIMMIIDKKENLKTLYCLGVSIVDIKNIFTFQGFLLTFFGMLIGLSIGVLLVLIQKSYGIFEIVPNLPYPVEFRFLNLFIVMITIIVLGFVASKIASSRITKQFIEQ